MRDTKVVINSQKLDYSCELMRALAHPLRLKILSFIDSNSEIPNFTTPQSTQTRRSS